MLLMLVYLLCFIPAAETCLQCERIIRFLHEDFILSTAIKYQIELNMICDHAYQNYKQTSRQRKGVIDPTTLYRARTEYQSEFNRFWNINKSGLITSKTIQILEKGNRILEKHLDTFIRDGLCPNKCGFLNRRVIDCLTCKFKMYICPSPSGQHNCGGKPEYYYSWAPGVPRTKKLNESDFVPLVVTHESSVVLNQLHLDEEGTYRCSLQEENKTIFYQVTFLLTDSQIFCHPALPTIWRQRLTLSAHRGPAAASHRHGCCSESDRERRPHSCFRINDNAEERRSQQSKKKRRNMKENTDSTA
ncbi:izumo sperm-egg fusion protein 1 isoform X3 [Oryzias latipes]